MKDRLTRASAKLRAIPGWIWIAPIILLGLYIRLQFLTKASLWHDEAFTATLAQLSPGDIIRVSASDVHPPLYHLVLHAWQLLFGTGVESLRGFSIVCGLGIIIALFFVLRRLFSQRIALLGSLFAAINPFLIRYSVEARMYTFGALLAVIATLVFIKACEPAKGKSSYWLWLTYGTLIASCLYTQYLLAFIIPAHLIYLWLIKGGSVQALKRTLADKYLWFSASVCFLAFAPWIPIVLSQLSNVRSGFWIPPVTLSSVPNTLSMFLVYDTELPTWMTFLLPVLIIPFSYLTAKNHPKQHASIWLLTSWLLLPMIIIALLSLRQPVYVDRYFTYCAPALCGLLAAYAFLLFNHRRLQAASLIAILLLACMMWLDGAKNVNDSLWNNTRESMNVINQNFRTGDIIISSEIYIYFHPIYYNLTGQKITLLQPEANDQRGEWGLVQNIQTPITPTLSEVKEKRIWLISREKTHEKYLKKVPPSWKLNRRHLTGDVIIELYER